MENSILNSIGIDPGLILIGLAVLTLISLITTLICFTQYKKLYRRYDMFMRGKDAETLEDTILDLMDETSFLRAEDRENKDRIQSMAFQVKAGYQKTGIVKYNAFKGMGGNLSFVIALLDDNNSGFILNSVHSREGCYTYIKEIVRGESYIELSEEERQCLEKTIYQEEYDIKDMEK